jgi:hypothetical protein
MESSQGQNPKIDTLMGVLCDLNTLEELMEQIHVKQINILQSASLKNQQLSKAYLEKYRQTLQINRETIMGIHQLNQEDFERWNIVANQNTQLQQTQLATQSTPPLILENPKGYFQTQENPKSVQPTTIISLSDDSGNETGVKLPMYDSPQNSFQWEQMKQSCAQPPHRGMQDCAVNLDLVPKANEEHQLLTSSNVPFFPIKIDQTPPVEEHMQLRAFSDPSHQAPAKPLQSCLKSSTPRDSGVVLFSEKVKQPPCVRDLLVGVKNMYGVNRIKLSSMTMEQLMVEFEINDCRLKMDCPPENAQQRAHLEARQKALIAFISTF